MPGALSHIFPAQRPMRVVVRGGVEPPAFRFSGVTDGQVLGRYQHAHGRRGAPNDYELVAAWVGEVIGASRSTWPVRVAWLSHCCLDN
jgi:hypothetical protein